MTYAKVWTWCWSLVAALGFTLSWLLWGTSTVGGLWAVASLLSGLFLAVLWTSAGHETPVAVQRSHLVGQSVLIGACAVAIIVIASVSPALAVTFLLLAIVTSPRAFGLYRSMPARKFVPAVREVENGKSAQPDGSRGALSLPQLHAQVPVQDLADDELCHEWRRSFVLLERAQFQAEFARVAALRRLLMDEIERRSPLGLNAWLSSGARAAGGPERYIEAERRRAASLHPHADVDMSEGSIDNEQTNRELNDPGDTGNPAA